jgi:DNA repair exonuclease SbcCD ATPase subunit
MDMKKELNHELFRDTQTSSQQTNSSMTWIEPAAATSTPDPRIFNHDLQISELKQHVYNLHEQMMKLASQSAELMKSSQMKFERLAQAVTRIESTQLNLSQEMSQKVATLSGRLNERKSIDGKVQEMVERHHQMLRGYEARLNQVQRLLTEKESQALSSQAALNEARMEIARLKRL